MRPAAAALVLACVLACACDAGAPREAASGPPREAAGTPARWCALGLQVRELPESARAALGLSGGVMVTRVRGPASRSRILPGDVIVRVGEAPVRDAEDFDRLVAGLRGRPVGLFIRRADSDLYVPLGAREAPRAPDELFRARRSPTGRPLRT